MKREWREEEVVCCIPKIGRANLIERVWQESGESVVEVLVVVDGDVLSRDVPGLLIRAGKTVLRESGLWFVQSWL